MRYDSCDKKILQLNRTSIENLMEQIIGQTNSNACGGFVIPQKFQAITSFHDEAANKERFQSFPGVITLYTLYKFTRT